VFEENQYIDNNQRQLLAIAVCFTVHTAVQFCFGQVSLSVLQQRNVRVYSLLFTEYIPLISSSS